MHAYEVYKAKILGISPLRSIASNGGHMASKDNGVIGFRTVFRGPTTTGTAHIRKRNPIPQLWLGVDDTFAFGGTNQVTELETQLNAYSHDYEDMETAPKVSNVAPTISYWSTGWDYEKRKFQQVQANTPTAFDNLASNLPQIGYVNRWIGAINDYVDPFYEAPEEGFALLAFPDSIIFVQDVWCVDIDIDDPPDPSTQFWSHDAQDVYLGWIMPLHKSFEGGVYHGARQEITGMQQRFYFKNR